MSLTTNFKVELAPHLTLTTIEGKLVLFSKSTGDFFGLNESAAFFLKAVTETDFRSALQLAQDEFSVPKETLEKDFLDLIQDLESLKLLKTVAV